MSGLVKFSLLNLHILARSGDLATFPTEVLRIVYKNVQKY